MTELIWSVGGFIVVVGLLVTVHEFGHFYVARRLGVRVLRFSVGFGRPLARRRGRDGTEYTLGVLPLGGYVRMLDESEGPVPEAQAGAAFNRQPLGSRVAIVAAGPAANLVFAILAYWIMFMAGVHGLRAQLGEVPPDSPAAQAGLAAGDRITAVAGRAVGTWEEASLTLLDHALGGAPVSITVERPGAGTRVLTLEPGSAAAQASNPLVALGFAPALPPAQPVIGEVLDGGAAQRAGLRPADRILAVDGVPVTRWEEWVTAVRANPGRTLSLTVERAGQPLAIPITPHAAAGLDGAPIGQVGTVVQRPALDPAQRVLRRYGPVDAAGAALAKTWQVSALTVHMLYRMVRGQASVQNLSGPITIAQFAGESARVGLAPFLAFIALVSVSLGLLNLLPIPVLDGGHLVYHAIELVRGAPPSERVRAVGQQGGIVLLLGLTFLALYNDIARLLS
jgi:regulator of sigma E protease